MMWKELWDSVEGLSDLIRKANWGIAIALALTLFCTVVVIVADKRRERLTRSADQVKGQLIAETNRLAGDASLSAQKLENANLTLRGQIAGLEKDASDAKRRQTEAEIQLAEVRRKQEPRSIPPEKFASTLRAAQPGKALIRFQQGNPEIAMLAAQLRFGLAAGGWDVQDQPVKVASIPSFGMVAIMSDIILVSGDIKGPSDKSSPLGGLFKALEECGFKRPTIFLDTTVPKDAVLIYIGPKT